MELKPHSENRADNYEHISGNIDQPWYMRRRKAIFMSVAILIAAVVICLIVVSRTTKPVEKEPDAFPIEWNNSCPQEIGECPTSFQDHPLLVISFGGFRPEYLKAGLTPTLDKLIDCGVTAPFMFPVFPSKTIPNLMSQVTGLYPSIHGIVDDIINDTGKVFNMSSGETSDPVFWTKDPIWVTAEKQGKKTATINWPGADVKIHGVHSTYYKTYNSSVRINVRINQVLEWLELPPERRPKLIMLYHHEPNGISQLYGLEQNDVQDVLLTLDIAIKKLISGLQQRNLTSCVDIILMSDHGLASLSCSKVINAAKYTDLTSIHYFLGPLGKVRPRDAENETALDTVISDFRCKNTHMRVYRKEEFPVRMHYSSHHRIEPIILELDAGWKLIDHHIFPGNTYPWCSGADYGYDNLFPEMKAYFTAFGPTFKKNRTVDPFINIELYELMCEILGIIPNANNGTRGSLHHLLENPHLLSSEVEPDPPMTAELSTSDNENGERVEAANCSCDVPWIHSYGEDDDVEEQTHFHLPFGIPYSSDDNETLRLLYNNDNVLAYDAYLHMPMWTSFTMTPEETNLPPTSICWHGDARVNENETVRCSDYNKTTFIDEDVLPMPLYPQEFSSILTKRKSTFITNSILKSSDYISSVEGQLNQLLRKWAEKHVYLNVVMGPAFDLHTTGIKPTKDDFEKEHEKYGRVIIPTHIFVVVTWCTADVSEELNECKYSQLETLGFLLPNKPFPRNCKRYISIIKKNVARVIDIENLTGLSFFTGIPIYDAVRLRTMMPKRDIS